MDLYVVTKPTNAYERTRVSYIINIISLLHVSATLVANLRGVHCKGHITEVFEPVHKSQVFGSFIMHLPEIGPKNGRNMQGACYVYNTRYFYTFIRICCLSYHT
jgi:hypothetical protein